MTRQKRILPANIPVHVVHRGVNKCSIFITQDDYEQYLGFLEKALNTNECAMHSYVLMTNHIHLLLTPGKDSSVSKVLHATAGIYANYYNKTYNRTGPLWEGRFKSCSISNDRYFLACMRYIELNPVRAAMVTQPNEYIWSSYHFNALGKKNRFLKPHPCYSALAKNPVDTQKQYRLMFERNLNIYINSIAPKGTLN